MAYILIKKKKYPFSIEQLSQMIHCLECVAELEDEGHVGWIGMDNINDRMGQKFPECKKISMDMLLEMALIGYLKHGKKSFKHNGSERSFKHTWLVNKKDPYTIEDLKKQTTKIVEHIENKEKNKILNSIINEDDPEENGG